MTTPIAGPFYPNMASPTQRLNYVPFIDDIESLVRCPKEPEPPFSSWNPVQGTGPYATVPIGSIVPKPGHVVFTGRIANLYETETITKLRTGARSLLKLVVKDKTGAIEVTILFYNCCGALLAVYGFVLPNSHASPGFKLINAIGKTLAHQETTYRPRTGHAGEGAYYLCSLAAGPQPGDVLARGKMLGHGV